MYNIYAQTKFSSDCSYKFIQLPPDLLEYVESGGGELSIKVPDEKKHYAVLCTENKTYQLIQMNHTNTVLLLNDTSVNKIGQNISDYQPQGEGEGNVVSFASLSYEYEPRVTSGHINVENLPVFDGQKLSSSSTNVTVNQILDLSPISKTEFFVEWYDLCGTEFKNQAATLSGPFVTEILSTLLTILIAERVDYRQELEVPQIIDWMRAQNTNMTLSFIETVLHKFGTCNKKVVTLDHEKIPAWFGLQALIDTHSRILTENDFLLSWKLLLPAFYNVPIDLKQLRGNFCRPLAQERNKIQHINPNSLLVGDLSARFKDLFSVSKEWDYDEFVPFIDKYLPVGKKPELLILKYARKRRMGKKIVVCQR